MSTGQKITVQPALTLVFAEHFHHATFRCEILVVRCCFSVPLALCCFKQGFQAIRKGFIRAKHSEIALGLVQLRHVSQKPAEDVRIADAGYARRGDLDGVVTKIGHSQVTQQDAAVGMRVRTHTALTHRCQFG